jgi:methionyl-tRNA formyltransferase
MRIIFFGTPEFAVPSLKALENSGEDISAVVTQPDRTKGRGRRLSAPPVKEYAASRGMAVLQPLQVRSPEFLDSLSVLKPEMIVVVAYGRIIPPSLLRLPPHGCINLHASILPKYRGAAPIQWAIVRGETKTGVTTMLMDEGLDTGDTLLTAETQITPEDNALILGSRLSMIGADLLVETIRGMRDGSVKPVPQAGEPSYAPIIRKDDGRIDWNASAFELFNLARGMFPWPGAFGFLQGEKFTLIRTKVLGEGAKGVPGRIEGISGDELYVATGKGSLSVIELRPEGKQTMSGAAFARGRHLREGMQFDR